MLNGLSGRVNRKSKMHSSAFFGVGALFPFVAG